MSQQARTGAIPVGRPRTNVDFGLVLALRQGDDVGHPRGWLSVAGEYRRRTGQYISKQTCRRRFQEMAGISQEMASEGALQTLSSESPVGQA